MRLGIVPERVKRSVLPVIFAVVLAPNIIGQSDQLPPATRMKVLGLIGGTSWYSTVDYYRYINKAVNDAYKNNTNPPLIVFNLNQQHISELQDRGEWDEIAAMFVDTINRLRASGAQGIVFCSNTSHKVYDKVLPRAGIPILHIGDATGLAIQKQRLGKVGLIGTQYTMEDPFLTGWLKQHYGIDVLMPQSPTVRRELHRIIHQELGLGIFKPETKQYVLNQIEILRKEGAQGIILGCTEFPLIVKPQDVSIPIFDTPLLHAQMAVDFIMGKPGLAIVKP
jgi:aspartate racemase